MLAEARRYVEAGKYGKAASSLKRILANDPQDWDALHLSATLNLKLGSLFAARSTFESLARKAFDRREYQLVQSLLKEYLAAVPRYLPFVEFMGQAHEASGDFAAAALEYDKALALLQEDADPDLMTKGEELYQRLKEIDLGKAVAQRWTHVFEGQGGAPPAGFSQPAEPTTAPAPDVAPPPGQPESAAPPVADSGDRVTAAPVEERLASAAPEVELPSPTPEVSEPQPPRAAPADKPPQVVPPETRPMSADWAETPRQTAPPSASPPPPAPPPATPPPAPKPVVVEAPQAPVSTPEVIAEPPEPPMREAPPAPPAKEPPKAAPSFRFAPESPAPFAYVSHEAPAQEEPPREELPRMEPPPPPPSAPAPPAPQPPPQWADLPPVAEPPIPDMPAVAQAPPTETFSGGAPPAEPASPWPVWGDTTEQPVQQRAEPAPDPYPERFASPVSEVDTYTPPDETSSGIELQEDPYGDLAEAEPYGSETQRQNVLPAWQPLKLWSSPSAGEAAPAAPEPAAPAWTPPQRPAASLKRLPPIRLFPTVAKLGSRVNAASQRAVSMAQSLAVLAASVATGGLVLILLAFGGLSLVWIGMEERASNAYYNLMKVPRPPVLAPASNGYVRLTGLGTTSFADPIRMRQGRTIARRNAAVPPHWPEGFAHRATALSEWYGTWDPAAEFVKHRDHVIEWSSAYRGLLTDYHQWINTTVEDLGFGALTGPDEALVLGAHRLYLAHGFLRGTERGVQRLEYDLESWRKALAQAKSLRFKMLAAEAVTDDLIVVSGLLGRSDLNRRLLPTLARMSRPMEQAERSLRWAMQNQFVLEKDMIQSHLKSDAPSDHLPLYLRTLKLLPLPTQKVLNAHAEFYEALAKHDAALKVEGDPRLTMPARYDLVNAPAKTFTDYLVNPIDNLFVTEQRVDWYDIIGRIVEVDARFRLATLQVHLRRGPAGPDPLHRIAGAGHAFYDPFTGFLMLLNSSKTVLYSVGRDGRDDDGDLTSDVSVPLRHTD